VRLGRSGCNGLFKRVHGLLEHVPFAFAVDMHAVGVHAPKGEPVVVQELPYHGVLLDDGFNRGSRGIDHHGQAQGLVNPALAIVQ